MVTSEVSKNLQISKLEFQVGRTVLHTVVMSRIYRYTQYRYRLGLYAARTPPPRLFLLNLHVPLFAHNSS